MILSNKYIENNTKGSDKGIGVTNAPKEKKVKKRVLKGVETERIASISIGLLSPEKILEQSYGEVTQAKAVMTGKTKEGHLRNIDNGFCCNKIFGCTKDYTCNCGKTDHRGGVCKVCGVEYTRKEVRRERMGHIVLAYPVVHTWFKKIISEILDISKTDLQDLCYAISDNYKDKKPKGFISLVENAEIGLHKGERYTKADVEDFIVNQGLSLNDFVTGGIAVRRMLQKYDYERYDAYKDYLCTERGYIEPEQCIHCETNTLQFKDGYKHTRDEVVINPQYVEILEDILSEYEEEIFSCEDVYTKAEEILIKLASHSGVHIDMASMEKWSVSQYIVNKLIEQKSKTYGCKDCKYFKGVNTGKEIPTEFKDNMAYAIQEIEESLGMSKNQNKQKKRLEYLKYFYKSKQKPEWMVYTVLPVLPVDLRSVRLMEGVEDKVVGVDDITTLYLELEKTNITAKENKQMKVTGGNFINLQSQEMLQLRVDSLIDNASCKKPAKTRRRVIKSFTDRLKGKKGRFRNNLLGKRVDYSGRSVIAIYPGLRMDEVGLPKAMAKELFTPFVIHDLMERTGCSLKVAKAKVGKNCEDLSEDVWESLENVMKKRYVMLNRAPSLHRISIQAFKPKLVEGNAIRLNPLVCTAYNADFDGDQMAVHVTLSEEAQQEAEKLMLGSLNLLKPSDGKPIAVPSQDMVLGTYYLTLSKEGEKGEGRVFKDVAEVEMAYNAKQITLHSKIKVRVKKIYNKKEYIQIVDTTYGKIILNQVIPQDLGYVDRLEEEAICKYEIDFVCTKNKLSEIVNKCINKHGSIKAAEMLDNIKALGFKYATKAGLTVAICDASIPKEKAEILKRAETEVSDIEKYYQNGYLSEDEKSKAVVERWNKATDDVTAKLKDNFAEDNAIWMMADSGARGSIAQLRQLAGMRGLIANASGTTIEIPIKRNYREGLTPLDYFVSARGARKGMADTALRTADAGYLTRRLVDVAHTQIIVADDCATKDGLEVKDLKVGAEVIESLEERLIGRYLLEPVQVGGKIIDTEHYLTKAEAQAISEVYETIKIRTPLKCKCSKGLCKKCYGKDLARNREVKIGEAVGVIAAQSIGEPGTQLTMRTFHTGGVANTEDITQGLPRVESLFEVTSLKDKKGLIAEADGIVSIIEDLKGKEIHIETQEQGKTKILKYKLAYNTKILVMDGDKVNKGDRLTQGYLYAIDILNVQGMDKALEYMLLEVQKAYRQQGVDIADKHIEVILRNQIWKKVEVQGDADIIVGTNISQMQYLEIMEELREREELGEAVVYPVVTDELQGVTKSASASDSFLGSASFQYTADSLVKNAIQGKQDYFTGLKANVIVGKLCPVGTGVQGAAYFD